MIRIDDLRFQYPQSTFCLHVSTLQIESGCAAAVVGPSGSGKTTLLNLIAGILPAESGSIVVDETEVTQLSDSARRGFRLKNVGLVFQDFELIEYLSVLDNVLLPCRIGNAVAMTPQTRERAAALIEQVGLRDHSRRSVTKLSQGERQRVAICRALLPEPTLLLADEPTGNLDPATSEIIMQLLLDQVKTCDTPLNPSTESLENVSNCATGSETHRPERRRRTLIMVTHDHSLLHHFDRTISFEQFLSQRTGEAAAGKAS